MDVKRIRREDLVEAAGTAGIRRQEAVSGDRLWAGMVRTDPDAASGWHHHSDNDTVVHVLEGRVRIEWAGGGSVEAVPGDFLHVPPRLVHREVNPDATPARAIVIRTGQGDPVVNVPQPD